MIVAFEHQITVLSPVVTTGREFVGIIEELQGLLLRIEERGFRFIMAPKMSMCFLVDSKL